MESPQSTLLPRSEFKRSKINPINFCQRKGAFEDVGEIIELECNEIISTWLFVFFFNLCFPFDDFLLLGSPSLCTKMPIHGCDTVGELTCVLRLYSHLCG